MKQFLSAADAGNVQDLVNEALQIKARPRALSSGANKRLGLVFMNPSLRTRVSTQIAARNLGMDVIVLNTSADGWQLEFEEGAVMNGSTVEHIRDAAGVMGLYFDILGVRTFPALKNREADYSENVLNSFVKYANIPVLSLESATRHPLQSLADTITIYENSLVISKRKPKVVLMWAPHIKPLPQCVANSFAEWMNAWSHTEFVISHPAGYNLDPRFIQDAPVVNDQMTALENADFVYVKNWSSVEKYGEILPVVENWMLTNEKLQITNNAKVMHCLPVRRNIELPDEILNGDASLVMEQAANRIWAAQTVLSELLKAE